MNAVLHLPLVFCLLLTCCGVNTDQDFIDDRAGLLDREARGRIVSSHRALLEDFNIHFRVVILDQPASDINQEAAAMFGDLGRKTGSARGMLFLVDPIGRQVRIEVGYDLERIFPDIFVAYLENKQMIPFFEQARVGAGIEATEELLVTRVQRSKDGESFDPAVELGPSSHYSGGGGARKTIAIGAGSPDKPAAVDPGSWLPQSSPEESLALYKELLHRRIKDPELEIYTPRTRIFLSNWTVTDAQQDNELRHLENSPIDKVIISGNRAVIRFPIKERTSPPYFLEHTGSGWAFDFVAMSEAIRMNHLNMWHLATRDHDYMFGFADWRFDTNGYPLPTQ